MKLLSNWRDVAKKAWSVRLLLVLCLFVFLDVFLSFFAFYSVWLNLLSAAVAVAALIARHVYQVNLPDE